MNEDKHQNTDSGWLEFLGIAGATTFYVLGSISVVVLLPLSVRTSVDFSTVGKIFSFGIVSVAIAAVVRGLYRLWKRVITTHQRILQLEKLREEEKRAYEFRIKAVQAELKATKRELAIVNGPMGYRVADDEEPQAVGLFDSKNAQ